VRAYHGTPAFCALSWGLLFRIWRAIRQMPFSCLAITNCSEQNLNYVSFTLWGQHPANRTQHQPPFVVKRANLCRSKFNTELEFAEGGPFCLEHLLFVNPIRRARKHPDRVVCKKGRVALHVPGVDIPLIVNNDLSKRFLWYSSTIFNRHSGNNI
jgi:hypothetical protein